jgi:hypothetical protein
MSNASPFQPCKGADWLSRQTLYTTIPATAAPMRMTG